MSAGRRGARWQFSRRPTIRPWTHSLARFHALGFLLSTHQLSPLTSQVCEKTPKRWSKDQKIGRTIRSLRHPLVPLHSQEEEVIWPVLHVLYADRFSPAIKKATGSRPQGPRQRACRRAGRGVVGQPTRLAHSASGRLAIHLATRQLTALGGQPATGVTVLPLG
jgi:hypothetical protein